MSRALNSLNVEMGLPLLCLQGLGDLDFNLQDSSRLDPGDSDKGADQVLVGSCAIDLKLGLGDGLHRQGH